MKYEPLILALEEDSLYTAGSITQFAEEHGFLKTEPTDRVANRQEKLRMRIALGSFARNHHFSLEGDGQLKLKGQGNTPAWFGWRWKSAIPTTRLYLKK